MSYINITTNSNVFRIHGLKCPDDVNAHHNLSVPQYILITSRVQYNTTGVCVNAVDMQNT